MSLRGTHVALLATVMLVCAGPAHALLPIERWETSSGARVYFVHSDDLPIVDVSVQFPAGSGRDTLARSGLAGLTLGLLQAGTATLDEEEVSRRLGDVGANLGQTFDYDRAGLSLRSLSTEANLAPALEVMAGILQAPSFPAAALEREKARVVAGLQESDAKPAGIASRTFGRLVYRDHPYGLRASGEKESVTHLTRGDLAQFHARFFNRRDAVVAIIGAVSVSAPKRLQNSSPRGCRKRANPCRRCRPWRRWTLRARAASPILPRRPTSSSAHRA